MKDWGTQIKSRKETFSETMDRNAVEEFLELLLDNDGEMELNDAVSRLSLRSRKYVKLYGPLEFVSRLPQLFTISRLGKSKVLVKLDISVEFCTPAGSKQGCSSRNCTQLHLCPFFIKNDCTYGDKCRRSHNCQDEHTRRILTHLQLSFLLGNPGLLESVLRALVDASELQRVASKRTVPDVCKFYNKASECKKGDHCPCLHVCEHYIDGDCKFGGGCKREHGFTKPHDRKILKEYGLEKVGEGIVLRCLRGGDRKFRSDTDAGTAVSDSNLARSGLLVPIVHGSELQREVSKCSALDVCKFYNKASGCKKEDQCPCLHVCEHYIDGDCKFGGGCKREHGFTKPHNRKILEKHGLGNVGEDVVLRCLRGRERKLSFRSETEAGTGVSDSNLARPSTSRNYHSDQTGKADNGKGAEICGFYLRGKCNYGNRCINHHTELPYLWEYSSESDGNGKWESLTSDFSLLLEQSFCKVNEEKALIPIKDTIYCINFQDMSAHPVDQMGVEKLKFRRRSTVSSAIAPAGHVYSTRWLWYWKDENGKWQSYDTPDDGTAPSTTSSQCLEREFLSGKESHPFSASHHKYTLYFKEWYQQNDKHKTRRPVRRRPELVTKQNMEDIAQRRQVTAKMAISSSSSGMLEDLPPQWTPLAPDEDYRCIQLQSISVEYKRTERKFLETMNGDHRIIKIERVQNPDLWTVFIQRKLRMQKKAGKDPEERQLFHGTSSDIVQAICQQGFDWRMCGKHGTKFGKGSYFACNANYSHRYSAKVVGSVQSQMFFARVLVGSYTNGESSFSRPPPKHPKNPNVLHDSCCDNSANPALFVIFENGQSYPEFLITYV